VAWNEYGGLLLKSGLLSGSLQAFQRAVSLRPEYRDASFNSAVVLFKLKEPDRALAGVMDHLHRFPADAQGWDLLGTIFAGQNKGPLSIQSGERAVELSPQNWKYRFNLGLSYVLTQNFMAAAGQLEKARDLSGNRHEVLSKLGTVYLLSGEWAKAERALQEVVRRWPEDSDGERQLKQVREIMSVTKGK
jgi:cytochrome c-type biogenesis protein CcmH/NrfG